YCLALSISFLFNRRYNNTKVGYRPDLIQLLKSATNKLPNKRASLEALEESIELELQNELVLLKQRKGKTPQYLTNYELLSLLQSPLGFEYLDSHQQDLATIVKKVFGQLLALPIDILWKMVEKGMNLEDYPFTKLFQLPEPHATSLQSLLAKLKL